MRSKEIILTVLMSTLITFYNLFSDEELLDTCSFTKETIEKSSICECCKDKEASVSVRFTYQDSCSNCKTHVYVSEFQDMCGLKCKNLYYDFEQWIKKSSKNDTKFKAIMSLERDDCHYCGSRVMSDVIADGHEL